MTSTITRTINHFSGVTSEGLLNTLIGLNYDTAEDLCKKQGLKMVTHRVWPGGSVLCDDVLAPEVLQLHLAWNTIIGIRTGDKTWLGLPPPKGLADPEHLVYHELSRRLNLWISAQNKASWNYDPEFAANPPPFPIKGVEFSADILRKKNEESERIVEGAGR